jgi:hypothetical protein
MPLSYDNYAKGLGSLECGRSFFIARLLET